jgi:hypothetical protein
MAPDRKARRPGKVVALNFGNQLTPIWWRYSYKTKTNFGRF